MSDQQILVARDEKIGYRRDCLGHDHVVIVGLALEASGLEEAKVIHRPRLLSDNGSSYVSAELAEWLDGQRLEHVSWSTYRPMAQSKFERWRRTLKNRIC